MNNRQVRRWTGGFGLAVVVLPLEFPLRVTLGAAPRLEDAARYADFVSRPGILKLSILLIDILMMACILELVGRPRYMARASGLRRLAVTPKSLILTGPSVGPAHCVPNALPTRGGNSPAAHEIACVVG